MNTPNASAAQEAQITAGPWHVNPRGFIVDSTGAIVTRMECSEDAGNARLIAAAPDLLAALQKIVDFSERTAHCTLADLGHVACAAIAKAEGNS